jgi:guanine nucleotide-binding protein G(i) subunit alpha
MGNSNRRLSSDPNYSSRVAYSRNIDQRTSKLQRKDMEYAKLLLLGAGESGKSTLFKQMISIYGNGFTKQELEKFGVVIKENCIENMNKIIDATETLAAKGMNTRISTALANEVKIVQSARQTQKITQDLVSAWRNLESDDGVKLALENRAKFQLGDSALYFFVRLPALLEPSYLPSIEDVLRVRIKTTGVVETEFQLMDNKFKLFDVGGQRSERKKWIHCFENVTGVIFVAAISEYDQVCAEDEKTNRIQEALTLFYEICNSKYLASTAMILFLNKEDILREKIRKVPLTEYDPSFKGESTFESASRFFTERFLEQNQNPERAVYVHITCATNKDNVSLVFQTVKDIVLKDSLISGGLM